MKLEIRGADQLARTLAQIGAGTAKEAAAALYAEAGLLATESIRRTPLDTGALRGSIKTLRPEVHPDNILVKIVAGGPAAPYALIVHEKMGSVNWQEPGTGPKYLENPVNEAAANWTERLARRIDLNRARRG